MIDLDLPVTGSLDDPKFKVGAIIWKVFVNLLKRRSRRPSPCWVTCSVAAIR
ncbi:MAG: hypothetical protein WDM77_20940 [Steroidobacteraceae bacterium]